MPLKDDFQKASKEVWNLKTKPSNDELLNLYALYKQATDGDVSGSKPGLLDLKGRAKYKAWTELKGTSKDEAMKKYVAAVKRLKG
ncbi:MAG TPA: acyl-CoA-binding protein [bacterium]|nr:acyl-CoA-binding protein [bacterium]